MNSMMGDKLTILVCTCDSYEDLWYPFFFLLEKYWANNPCRIVLNTERKSYQYKNLNIESLGVCNELGDITYGKRIRENIKAITTPYTLVLLDDFFIRRDVDVPGLEKTIKMMETHPNVAAVYFNKYGLGEMDSFECADYEQMKRYAMYKLNMQAGIWDTQKLLSYWEEIDNPWKWEIFANYATFDSKDQFLCLKDEDNTPVFYGYNPEGMGVFRGKWVLRDVEPLFAQHGIVVDYEKRGAYVKAEEKNYFANKKETACYMLQRMKLKYIIGICSYYTKRWLYRKLNKPMKYNSYPEQLQGKYEQKMKKHQ